MSSTASSSTRREPRRPLPPHRPFSIPSLRPATIPFWQHTFLVKRNRRAKVVIPLLFTNRECGAPTNGDGGSWRSHQHCRKADKVWGSKWVYCNLFPETSCNSNPNHFLSWDICANYPIINNIMQLRIGVKSLSTGGWRKKLPFVVILVFFWNLLFFTE